MIIYFNYVIKEKVYDLLFLLLIKTVLRSKRKMFGDILLRFRLGVLFLALV
jgi:hypothetical protein